MTIEISRLAGAVGADQPEDLPGGDLEVDAAEHLILAVRHGHPGDPEYGVAVYDVGGHYVVEYHYDV